MVRSDTQARDVRDLLFKEEPILVGKGAICLKGSFLTIGVAAIGAAPELKK
jgi:hypothetical protein